MRDLPPAAGGGQLAALGGTGWLTGHEQQRGHQNENEGVTFCCAWQSTWWHLQKHPEFGCL